MANPTQTPTSSGPRSTYRDKIVSLQRLKALVAQWRAAGDSIVLANGCFDLLHAGHVRYLAAARNEGQRLVVAINSDDSVRNLKGRHRPILPQQARAELVAALAVVDAVIVFPEADVEKLLRSLRPHVHAKGTDYAVDSVPERATASATGTRIAIVGDPKQHSTRDLLARIAHLYQTESASRSGQQQPSGVFQKKAAEPHER